jgi:hypothetical protein
MVETKAFEMDDQQKHALPRARLVLFDEANAILAPHVVSDRAQQARNSAVSEAPMSSMNGRARVKAG